MKKHKGQNPIPVVYRGKNYKSMAELAREYDIDKSAVSKALSEDRPLLGYSIDESIKSNDDRLKHEIR
jgi:hypothetical protein